jgi:hypothetical protein
LTGVGVGVDVSAGGIDVFVSVGGGVSVMVGLSGTISVTPGMMVTDSVGVKIIGVALTIFGVYEGGTIHVATGCGGTPNISHAARMKTRARRGSIFFMKGLYSRALKPHYPPNFLANCSSDGSTSISPLGKIMVGTIRFPLLSSFTNDAASTTSSTSIFWYSILCLAKNAFARLQSGHHSAPYMVMMEGFGLSRGDWGICDFSSFIWADFTRLSGQKRQVSARIVCYFWSFASVLSPISMLKLQLLNLI